MMAGFHRSGVFPFNPQANAVPVTSGPSDSSTGASSGPSDRRISPVTSSGGTGGPSGPSGSLAGSSGASLTSGAEPWQSGTPTGLFEASLMSVLNQSCQVPLLVPCLIGLLGCLLAQCTHFHPLLHQNNWNIFKFITKKPLTCLKTLTTFSG